MQTKLKRDRAGHRRSRFSYRSQLVIFIFRRAPWGEILLHYRRKWEEGGTGMMDPLCKNKRGSKVFLQGDREERNSKIKLTKSDCPRRKHGGQKESLLVK